MLAVTASLYVARAFFTPLVLGLLISYSLYPMVSFLHHRVCLPRAIGAALMVMAIVMASFYAIVALQQQVVALIEKVPAVLQQAHLSEQVSGTGSSSMLGKIREAASEIDKAADNAAEAGARAVSGTGDQTSADDAGTESESVSGSESDQPGTGETADSRRPALSAASGPTRVVIDRGPGQYFNYLLDGSMGFLVLTGQALIVLLFVFFTLASGDLYKVKLVKVSGKTLTEKKVAVQILENLNDQLRVFLFVTLIGAIFVALFTWAVFWWLGMEQALLWGVIAGVASVVPYVGPAFVFFASAVTAFLQFGTLGQALLIAGASLAITSFQGNLLTPLMTSRAASMNAVAVFISLLFWGWLWGPVGLIVATPVLMVIKAICDHVENLQGIGEFISDERRS